MIGFEDFFNHIGKNRLAPFATTLKETLSNRYQPALHGDYRSWQEHFQLLPEVSACAVDVARDCISIGTQQDLTEEQHQKLLIGLRGLHPWRKGPFQLFGHTIETEWRSDWKWQRVLPHIKPLADRFVLDIGCGSGYHCWRMLGEQAKFVLGIDPSPKFVFQFQAVKKYIPHAPVYYLPLRAEDLPKPMQAFDTVFSMGVLYHRKSPFDHLEELKSALRPGGELVLETLVVPGDENTVLLPADRYAQMRNVWFIGSALATQRWVQRAGFRQVRIVDEAQTTTAEQHSTAWMTFNSLADFLDSNDPNKTLEGYPAPRRAIIVAEKPGKSLKVGTI